MDRLKALGALLVVVLTVFTILRLVHLAAGALSPVPTPGPLFLTGIEEVEEQLGFQPWVPAYHPMALGDEPITILVERSPVPRITLTWRGERFAVLEESLGDSSLEPPPDAVPVPDHPSTVRWARGETQLVVAPRGDLEILLRSDLAEEDVIRMLSTLHPARPRP